jgi:hypothetical protein
MSMSTWPIEVLLVLPLLCPPLLLVLLRLLPDFDVDVDVLELGACLSCCLNGAGPTLGRMVAALLLVLPLLLPLPSIAPSPAARLPPVATLVAALIAAAPGAAAEFDDIEVLLAPLRRVTVIVTAASV